MKYTGIVLQLTDHTTDHDHAHGAWTIFAIKLI